MRILQSSVPESRFPSRGIRGIARILPLGLQEANRSSGRIYFAERISISFPVRIISFFPVYGSLRRNFSQDARMHQHALVLPRGIAVESPSSAVILGEKLEISMTYRLLERHLFISSRAD